MKLTYHEQFYGKSNQMLTIEIAVMPLFLPNAREKEVQIFRTYFKKLGKWAIDWQLLFSVENVW